MEFEYTDCFYVSEGDLDEICDNVKHGSMTIQEAVNDWAAGLDDCDFYRVGNIEDDLIAKIEEMLKGV